jgi:hypothetical protein
MLLPVYLFRTGWILKDLTTVAFFDIDTAAADTAD